MKTLIQYKLSNGTGGSVVIVGLIALMIIAAAGCAHTGEMEPANAPSEEYNQESDPSASVITSEEIQNAHVTRVEELLEGRVAGVRVFYGPSGYIHVRIRGRTSLLGSNEPLYVVDGIPLTTPPGMGLVGINPYDIESIKVLKGPAASRYGVRGANGVVVVTTK